MKKYIILVFLISTGIALAQEKSEINQTKHNVKSIVYEQFSIDWYKNQKKLWEQEISKDKHHLNAYFNVYMAIRAIRNLSEDLSLKNEYDSLGKVIAQNCYDNNKNSFEGNYLMYTANNYSDINYLYKAHEIAPNDDRAYISLMTEAEYQMDEENRKKYAELVFTNNKFSPGLLNWTYNLIIGLEKNAIIITHGDNDTYGAWINQAVNNTRTDVIVLNSFMLSKDEYRKKVYKKLGMESFYKPAPSMKSNDDYDAFIAQNLSEIMDHSNRPFYVTNTNRPHLFGNRKEQFYIVGLAYQYCKENMDNISVIRNNFENKFKLDYLETNFYADPSSGNVARSSSGYLAAMIKLFNHYCLSGELEKARNLKKIIEKIALDNNLKDQVEPELNGKC